MNGNLRTKPLGFPLFPKQVKGQSKEDYHTIVMVEYQHRKSMQEWWHEHRRTPEQEKEYFADRVRFWHDMRMGEIDIPDTMPPLTPQEIKVVESDTFLELMGQLQEMKSRYNYLLNKVSEIQNKKAKESSAF